jgi:hypothetical protein
MNVTGFLSDIQWWNFQHLFLYTNIITTGEIWETLNDLLFFYKQSCQKGDCTTTKA